VGGELNTSDAENVGEIRPLLIRDNYDAEDVRLDLAYAGLEAGGFRLQAGRFFMPVGFTEMIWDRDLRPQGVTVGLMSKDASGADRAGLTLLATRGSHVFEDDETEMLVGSVKLGWASGPDSSVEVTGSFVYFNDLAELEPMIRRQNSRVDGLLTDDYKVIDAVVRVRREGGLHSELVANYCWNVAADELNNGLWLAGVFGSTRTARARLEYTYARVERDATVAAYATDDFFWGTGWEGHRVDLGVRVAQALAVHVTGQMQRFKDSPRIEEQDHWVRRIRLDVRLFID
jgi:hypothetical protein